MTAAFISHSDCLLHNLGDNHPESPARLRIIENTIKKSELNSQIKYYQAPQATREQISQIHDEAYVDYIFSQSPNDDNLVWLDPDTGMNSYTLKAALHAAGAVILAVDLIMAQERKVAFCNVRPPGHHAEKDKAQGFCIFNNIAVGVAHALSSYGVKRIAIVDFDAHHGNGTENIFLHQKNVLYCSTFQSPFYPFAGEDTESEHIINIPLDAGAKGMTFREEAESMWFAGIKTFKPDLLFISAGFDGYIKDEMSDLLLRIEDFAWISHQLKMLADQYCGGRIISVLEGGYFLNDLGRCVLAHLRGLVE